MIVFFFFGLVGFVIPQENPNVYSSEIMILKKNEESTNVQNQSSIEAALIDFFPQGKQAFIEALPMVLFTSFYGLLIYLYTSGFE